MKLKNWWLYLLGLALIAVSALVVYKYKPVREKQKSEEYAQSVYEDLGDESINRQDPVARNVIKSGDGKNPMIL